MTNQEIKTECELMYSQLREAEDRLKKIRAICKHENTFEGNWSWRVGSSTPAVICSVCGSLVKLKELVV